MLLTPNLSLPAQLSWTEDYETSKLGVRTINFYDEEGATAIRKVCVLPSLCMHVNLSLCCY